MVGDLHVRRYSGSTRPPYIWPLVRLSLSPKQKETELKAYKAEIKLLKDTKKALHGTTIDVPAALAPPAAILNRTIIELCCGPRSKLSDPRYEEQGCNCVRITETHDLTTDVGMDYAIRQV